jgi:succinoglycan biosynthesis transport protein ExoP
MEPSELDVKYLLRLVYKKKALLTATAIVVSGLIVVFCYLLPKTYEAKSVIFIERNVLNELIKNVTVTSSFEDKARALSVIMKSRSLILKVMTDLDFDLAAKSADEVEGILAGFQEKTVIEMEVSNTSRRDMDLFIVSFTDKDPRLASNYVNSLVRRYIEENLSQKRAEAYGASQFLLDQISSFKVKLDKIETAIAKQRKEKNLPEKSVGLYEQLQTLLRKQNELLVLYTENHPEVMKIKAEIETLEAQMKKMPVSSGPDTGVLELERERDTTRKIYEDLMSTLRKSEVSAQMEVQDKAGAFRIVDPAIVPTRPLSPNMVRMIMLAIVGGIAAGLGLTIVSDRMDGSVKSVSALKNMGLPILAVISTMQTEEEASAGKRRNKVLYTTAASYLAVLLLLATMEAAGLGWVDEFVQGTKVEIGNALKKIRQPS